MKLLYKKLPQPGDRLTHRFRKIPGEVIAEAVEVGDEAEGVEVGDRFVTYSNYHEVHVIMPDAWPKLGPNVSPETGISLPFAGTTLNCTRKANIQIGVLSLTRFMMTD